MNLPVEGISTGPNKKQTIKKPNHTNKKQSKTKKTATLKFGFPIPLPGDCPVRPAEVIFSSESSWGLCVRTGGCGKISLDPKLTAHLDPTNQTTRTLSIPGMARLDPTQIYWTCNPQILEYTPILSWLTPYLSLFLEAFPVKVVLSQCNPITGFYFILFLQYWCRNLGPHAC